MFKRKTREITKRKLFFKKREKGKHAKTCIFVKKRRRKKHGRKSFRKRPDSAEVSKYLF